MSVERGDVSISKHSISRFLCSLVTRNFPARAKPQTRGNHKQEVLLGGYVAAQFRRFLARCFSQRKRPRNLLPTQTLSSLSAGRYETIRKFLVTLYYPSINNKIMLLLLNDGNVHSMLFSYPIPLAVERAGQRENIHSNRHHHRNIRNFRYIRWPLGQASLSDKCSEKIRLKKQLKFCVLVHRTYRCVAE